jgi:hypothetical protein
MKIVASTVLVASGVLFVGYWMTPVRAQQTGASQGDAQNLTPPPGLHASAQRRLARRGHAGGA